MPCGLTLAVAVSAASLRTLRPPGAPQSLKCSLFPSPLAHSSSLPTNHLVIKTTASSISLCRQPKISSFQSSNSKQRISPPPISETLQSRRSLHLITPPFNPSPKVTQKTSSLCQAKSRSRISRAAVCLSTPCVCFHRPVPPVAIASRFRTGTLRTRFAHLGSKGAIQQFSQDIRHPSHSLWKCNC